MCTCVAVQARGAPAALLPKVLLLHWLPGPALSAAPPQQRTALTAAEQGACLLAASCPLSLSSTLTVVLKSRRSHLPVVLRARFPCGCVCSCLSLFLAVLQGMQTQAGFPSSLSPQVLFWKLYIHFLCEWFKDPIHAFKTQWVLFSNALSFENFFLLACGPSLTGFRRSLCIWSSVTCLPDFPQALRVSC